MARNLSGIAEYVVVYETGKSLYTFFVNVAGRPGYVFDRSAAAFALAPTYANTAVPHVETGSNGVYRCPMPNLGAGIFSAVTCEKPSADATPANTDTQLFTETITNGL